MLSTLLPVAEIEAACLSAWPAIKTHLDGSWLWRFAQGYTKRSNSVQCLDPDDDEDADRRIARMVALSARNGIPPLFRVTPLAGLRVIAALGLTGWEAFEQSRVLARRLDGTDFDVAHPVRLFEPTDPNWYQTQADMAGLSRTAMDTSLVMLGLIAGEARGVIAYAPGGNPAAAALAVNTGVIGIYVDVVTDATKRRNGYGRAAMQAALNWTRSTGADFAAIQVVANNAPAARLYETLGFVEQYRYHYRRPVAHEELP